MAFVTLFRSVYNYVCFAYPGFRVRVGEDRPILYIQGIVEYEAGLEDHETVYYDLKARVQELREVFSEYDAEIEVEIEFYRSKTLEGRITKLI